jgi:oligoribonuclease NrnB/cAMP/cGMP phosphodiesterase (DHH superfamily)
MTFLDVTLSERKKEVPEETAAKLAYDWRYENNINSNTTKLDLDTQEFKYNKWRTNSSMSNFLENIMFANEMNLNSHITDQMHYDYLFYSVKKKKRFASKKTARDKEVEKLQKVEEANLAIISEYYKYNIVKSKAALKTLTDSQLEIIRKRLEKGGVR